MADTPEHGGRPKPSAGPSAASAQVEVADDDSSTTVTPVPTARTPRPSLRRIRPSFLLDLVEGSPVGEYEIQAQIGEGAMGTVYSAIHPLIGKQVAVKVLKPELCANQASIDRFVHEAQAVNKIGHPNIVDVFSLGELPDGRAYFVMEWLRGEDLKTRLARGPVPLADACDILDGIARALDAAHAKDIVHRDLKPDNVFLHQVEDGPVTVKLLDFGIAKLVRVTPGTEKTQTGNMLGTPRYISPEQARGVNVDHRSDIYSLGVMAYEVLAGQSPFDGETAMDLVVKHLSEPPPPLSQFTKVPKPLEQCVMRMLAKDPEARPSLEEVRGILVDPSKRLTPLPRRLRPPRRWPMFAAAAVAAIGVGVVTWKLVGDARLEPSPPPPPPAVVHAVAPTPVVAPVPPPPPPLRGTLEVDVTGSKDAVILVDGVEWGRGASIKIELPPGGHDVVVKAPGHAAIAQHVELGAGQANTATRARASGEPAGAQGAGRSHKARRRRLADARKAPGAMIRALVIVVALATAAHADDDKGGQAEADRLFEQAQADYRAGQFQAAIELFKQAYQLVDDPVYLFNIAQSYRKVLDCEAAFEYYTRYLTAAPKAENRAKVEQWLTELQPCVDKRQKEHEAAKRGEDAERARRDDEARRRRVAQAPRDQEVDGGRWFRIGGIAAGAVGVVGIAAGIGYSIEGKHLRDQVAAACTVSCNWDDWKQRDSDGKRANTFAAVGYIGGGVALAAGAALYLVGRARVDHVLVTPTEGGAAVTAMLRF